MKSKAFERRSTGYFVAVVGQVAVTAVLKLFRGHINATTVALALLLVVLFVATGWGARPAIAASLFGVLCFNFFFLPPVGTLIVATSDNWVALGAFLITAITVGQLSARAKRRTEEADAGRREIERLYKELREAFERASQAEALKKSERLKSALLDAVTHDLRTPLTSIKASVTTLLDEQLSKTVGEESAHLDAEGRSEMLEVINEETDRLNRFIESMMELARIEAGEMQLRRRWGSVEEIITAAMERAAPLMRGHTVEVSLESELPAVRVDARAVAEVIYTLLDNAVKYSPKGTNIRVAASRGGEETIRMSVEDKGRGIPAEWREQVFDKFFRAMRDGDAGAKDQPSGTGLGLAIARGIVEAHNGRIWIEDGIDNLGTRVVIALPIGDDREMDSEQSRQRNFVKVV
jgi:two-component system sensor histidine kinase KdpD